jgi:hypothetical protein
MSPSGIGSRTLSRIRWRLLPFLGLLYIASYLDCVNVSFAKLTMNAAIGIDDATYAFGAASSSSAISSSRCRRTWSWNASARGAGSRAS